MSTNRERQDIADLEAFFGLFDTNYTWLRL